MNEHIHHIFREQNVLHHLKHYLPSQAPLKDFIHHNTLHAFQDRKFFTALTEATEILGYKTRLSLAEYRELYTNGKINQEILTKITREQKGQDAEIWKEKMINGNYIDNFKGRIGLLRSQWKKLYSVDPDLQIHPFLFRFLASYLDQGIAIQRFPDWQKGFLTTIREMEKNTFTGFFRTPRARKLLLDRKCEIADLLDILVGKESLYEQYLFDQQFAHPGWSGMVSVLEDNPKGLIDTRRISLQELIIFELLLEIDVLDNKFGENWMPLGLRLKEDLPHIFDPVKPQEYHEVLRLWQLAYEWTYYDQVLGGITLAHKFTADKSAKSFQALFCIDDRECSLRRYIEAADPKCETFGTPGFFNVEFYYKPMFGKFTMKVCPAPMTPKYLIREEADNKKNPKDFHFSGHTHSLLLGWIVTHTIGLWSAIRLFLNIFIPGTSPATTNSFRHMDKFSRLSIVNVNPDDKENGLQVGYTFDEMTDRVEGLLKSIGLVKNFAPIIYVVGHGASSVNNTHYAGYDCGACSGRPGSVNARVVCFMANHPEVRKRLSDRGIHIPATTLFMGGLHDTTRDEIEFYDETLADAHMNEMHQRNKAAFRKALVQNAVERSRRFENIDPKSDEKKVYALVQRRSVSLFEPRPELNHATNTLCVVGRRQMTDHLFLDRRAFMNSYDYSIDPEGNYLFNILKAAAPVCGGINLEYYFSRTDNQKTGAGTKLPHNVVGLIGVSNGTDGDLRTGLPQQMIEVHDPLRLLIIVEHFEDVVLKVIRKTPELYEWFENEWIHLVAVNPETYNLSYFTEGRFIPYEPLAERLPVADNVRKLVASTRENIPVHILS